MTFRIRYEIDTVLSKEMLWPDGDGPEQPTTEDVTNLIVKCGGFPAIINDWNLNGDSDWEVTIDS